MSAAYDDASKGNLPHQIAPIICLRMIYFHSVFCLRGSDLVTSEKLMDQTRRFILKNDGCSPKLTAAIRLTDASTLHATTLTVRSIIASALV